MTATVPQLPIVEKVLAAFLTPKLDGVRVGSAVPGGLAGVLPVIQVVRLTGAVYTRRHDRAFVDVNTFHADDDQASDLATRAEALLLAPINQTFPDLGALLSGATSVNRPRWVQYPNTAVRLWAGTYEVRLRSA